MLNNKSPNKINVKYLKKFPTGIEFDNAKGHNNKRVKDKTLKKYDNGTPKDLMPIVIEYETLTPAVMEYSTKTTNIEIKNANTRIKKRQKEKSNIDTKKYFIGFIDILGFSKLIENKSIKLLQIYKSLERILIDLKSIHLTGFSNKSYMFTDKNGKKITKNTKIIKNTPKYSQEILENYMVNFSDSIIFYIEIVSNLGDNIERFKSICWLINEFIAIAILHPNNQECFELPLRGAISYGDAIIDNNNNIHIGKPIVDSYLLSEHQNWMGGAIHPNKDIEKYIKPLIGYDNEILLYKVPINQNSNDTKCYEIETKYSLNWVNHHHSNKNWISDLLRPGPTLRDIGNHINKHNWNGVLEKKKNTLDFVSYVDKKWNNEYGVEKSTGREFYY